MSLSEFIQTQGASAVESLQFMVHFDGPWIVGRVDGTTVAREGSLMIREGSFVEKILFVWIGGLRAKLKNIWWLL